MAKCKDFDEVLARCNDLARNMAKGTLVLMVIYDTETNRMRTITTAPNPDLARGFMAFALEKSFAADVDVQKVDVPS